MQLFLRELLMACEIVISTIMNTTAFNPSKTVSVDLNVPCVLSIMSFLSFHVLTKSHLVFRETHVSKDGVSKIDTPCISLFLKMTFLECIRYRHFDGVGFSFLLSLIGKKRKFYILDSLKLRPVLLIFFKDEYLTLCLCELAKSQHTLTWGNLIAVSLTNLKDRHR